MNQYCVLLIVMAGMLCPVPGVLAHEGDARAHYLANEGVMIAHGERKIVFDPLFNESFGQYQLLPDAMRRALFAGKPPWDSIDAVFISHYHDDHFSPADMRDFLLARSDVHLFAPKQAVDALLRELPADTALADRITSVSLQYGDQPRRYETTGLTVEAVRIPHSGWPSSRLDVENIAWRVTLDGAVTVLHLGDADPRDVHFARDSDYWDELTAQLALPSYWFFLAPGGRKLLQDRLQPEQTVGIHVPVTVPANPDQREPGLRDADLFQVPGETRLIEHRH